MVTRRFRVPALTRKLLRDVWAMKGQAFAIAAVVAAGVTMFVTYLSNFDSLRRTLDAYYASERLADVFAAAARVPEPVAARLAVLPGVTTVETRVVADVVLDLPGLVEPASGRLVSLPRQGAPRLNAVRLRRGAWPDPARPDEVIANEVNDKVLNLPRVEECTVNIVFDPPWDRSMMTEEAKLALGM